MISYIGNIQVMEDDLDLFDKLVEADGKENGSVFIYDETLRMDLWRQGYIHLNDIGWSYATERLKTLVPKLKKTAVKFNVV